MSYGIEDKFKDGRNMSFVKGDIILSPEKNEGCIFHINSGLVRIFSISEKGDEVTLGLFTSNEIFPIWSLGGKHKNIFYFEALTEVEVSALKTERCIEMIKDCAVYSFEIMSLISKQYGNLLERNARCNSGIAYEQTSNLLFDLAERVGIQKGDYVIIKEKLSHKLLASWLGTSRETISRVLSKMSKDGLIDNIDGYISINTKKTKFVPKNQ